MPSIYNTINRVLPMPALELIWLTGALGAPIVSDRQLVRSLIVFTRAVGPLWKAPR